MALPHSLNRRDFLKTGAALVAGGATLASVRGWSEVLTGAGGAPAPLPRRVLGKTGVAVSILGMGGVGLLTESTDADLVQRYVHEALDAGINYFDVAFSYGKDGQCEKNLGLVMGTPRRREAFLATKCEDRTYDGALKQVETSLHRRVDRLDLIQIHHLYDKDNVPALGAKTGVLTALRRLQDQKVVRFIGLTGHANYPQVKEALAMYDWDTFLCFINPARACRPVFTDQLPIARQKNIGVIAMKTFGGGEPAALIGAGEGKADAATLLRYAWSQPVTLAIPGMSSLAHLRQNLATARAFQPMSAAEQTALVAKINAPAKGWHE